MEQQILDNLDAFEVRQMVPEALESHRQEGKQSITQDIFQYISQTHFFESLRNNYSCFKQFSHRDIKKILKTGKLFRVRNSRHNMIINFSQPTVCIVIFGQLTTEGKNFVKGDFFIIRQDRVEMFFRHKTTLVMLHKEDVQNKLYQLQNFYFKKKQILKIIPIDVLQLTRSQLQKLAQEAHSLEGSSLGTIINKSGNIEDGVFILFEGNFALKMESGICLTEIGYDYYGQEILWSSRYSYGLQALTVPYRLIFLPKTLLLDVLTETNIRTLQQLHNKKLQIRNQMLENIENNIQFTKKFLKKIEVVNKVKNLQYKEINGKITKKPVTRQFVMKHKELYETNNNNSSPIVEKTAISSSKIKKGTGSLESTQYTTYSNFRTTIYKDQRAKSQKLFRNRTKTEPGRKRSLSNTQTQKSVKGKRVKTEANQSDAPPKTISVLLKYYQSMNPMAQTRRRQDKSSQSKIFLSSSRERRLVTNLKLHREVFFREFLEENHSKSSRAFKAWK